jgi:hypothetical protein
MSSSDRKSQRILISEVVNKFWTGQEARVDGSSDASLKGKLISLNESVYGACRTMIKNRRQVFELLRKLKQWSSIMRGCLEGNGLYTQFFYTMENN